MLRGTSAGLEFVFVGRPFEDAWTEMSARLIERPDFYRGSQATAIFDDAEIPDADVRTFLDGIAEFGIVLRGVYGEPPLEALAARHTLPYLGVPPRPTIGNFERKRAARAERPMREITDRAKSLDADFAGARADIAKRRAQGEPSVPRPNFSAVGGASALASVATPPVDPPSGTLYHRGTLRGGQILQQLGTIVVVGDVNPGAELVATGDIVVVGALRGTAHAGAQGDESARVIALELAPTQLRIATFIAADDSKLHAVRARGPEVALVENGRIAIAALAEVRV
jgi:septum site-determining protein MinC